MFKVKRVGENMRHILWEQNALLISYETPVAMYDATSNTIFRTDIRWSASTAQHISRFLRDLQVSAHYETIKQEGLDRILKDLNGDVRFLERRGAKDRYSGEGRFETHPDFNTEYYQTRRGRKIRRVNYRAIMPRRMMVRADEWTLDRVGRVSIEGSFIE